MAYEAAINSSLNIQFPGDGTTPPKIHSKNFSFQATVTEYRGPTPGVVLATTTGVAVSLAQLTNPGLCTIQNLSEDYRVLVGIKDTSAGTFLPLLELLPGEGYTIRLARMIEDELSGGSGTGTAGSGGTLFVKSIGGSAYVDVQAFEA